MLAGCEKYGLENQRNTFENIRDQTRPDQTTRRTAGENRFWKEQLMPRGFRHKKSSLSAIGSLERRLFGRRRAAFCKQTSYKMSSLSGWAESTSILKWTRWDIGLLSNVRFLISGISFCDGPGGTRGAWLPLHLCQWSLQIATGFKIRLSQVL